MILSTCPHHPTLLTILLDVCTMWSLGYESCTLLGALLMASVSPTTASPICHPAHSSYLLDLCATWTVDRNETVDCRPTYTKSVFVQILVDVLTTINTPNAWMCKAVTKLAREVRKSDFLSFVNLAAGLADTIGHIEGGERTRRVRGKTHHLSSTTSLRDRLGKWMSAILDRLWANMGFAELEILASPSVWFRELEPIVAFLRHAQSSALHFGCHHYVIMEDELRDSTTCLATCCLSALSYQHGNTADVQDLVDLLSETTPITSTFDNLVALVLNGEDLSYSQKNWHKEVLYKLRKLAALLQSYSLLKLEASLWACALRCLERDSLGRSSLPDGVEMLKAQITDAVDDAEMRCFGSVTRPSTSKPQGSKRPSVEEGEWEWEEMVGCWIQRSPVLKRPKLEARQSTIRSQRVTRSGMIRRQKHSLISVNPTPSTSSSTKIPRSSTWATSEPFTDPDEDYHSKKNRSRSNASSQPVQTRRIVNFASILADAQVNRTALHPDQSAAPSSVMRTVTRSDIPKYQGNFHHEYRPVSYLDNPSLDLPSDDLDSLDLFAYAQSSPCTHS
jgi:hypothetical protein